MKASKLIVLAGGVLGIIAFFLPIISVNHRGTTISVSSFQIVKGIGDIQAAADTDEVKAHVASMDSDGQKIVKDANAELDKVKGFFVGIFVPALLIALIGGLGVVRRRFGRVAGVFSLLLGLLTLGIGALLRAAAAEVGEGAGISMTLLLVTGLAGLTGGIFALVSPERAAAPPLPPARTV